MKKFLILISLLFVTVCYAAPPPVFDIMEYESSYDVGKSDVVVTVPETGIDAQEVAFDYVTYSIDCTGYETTFEPAAGTEPAEKPVAPAVYAMNANTEGPPLKLLFSGAINNGTDFLINRQHSNYGYPFSAN